MKVYSPTQTDVFAFCPQARQFYKEGWQPRIADKPMIAAWMGIAMGAGLEAYYKKSPISPELAGANSWAASVATFRKQNGVVEDSDIAGIPTLLAKALAKYPKMDPIPADWVILGVEQAFPDHGNARMDLVVQTQYGVATADFKWKKSLYTKSGETIAQARGRTLLEYENYWNMLHYQWALREQMVAKVPGYKLDPAYYIILGELGPSPHVMMQRFEVPEAVLRQWEHTAEKLWEEMEDADIGEDPLTPRGNTTHRNQYGLCKYYDACFTHVLDREKMQTKYVQIKRSK